MTAFDGKSWIAVYLWRWGARSLTSAVCSHVLLLLIENVQVLVRRRPETCLQSLVQETVRGFGSVVNVVCSRVCCPYRAIHQVTNIPTKRSFILTKQQNGLGSPPHGVNLWFITYLLVFRGPAPPGPVLFSVISSLQGFG